MKLGKHLTKKHQIFIGSDDTAKQILSYLMQSHNYSDLCRVREALNIQILPTWYYLPRP